MICCGTIVLFSCFPKSWAFLVFPLAFPLLAFDNFWEGVW